MSERDKCTADKTYQLKTTKIQPGPIKIFRLAKLATGISYKKSYSSRDQEFLLGLF